LDALRFASRKDAQMLGELNHQFIEDEGHRNRMTIPELATRAEDWLADGYLERIKRRL
jgi:hypothetical protein